MIMPHTSPALPSRDQDLSAICARGCAVLAVCIPLAVVAIWSVGSWKLLGLVRLVPHDILADLPQGVQVWQRITGALICLVPTLLVSYGLLRARCCLVAFARGDFFAAEAIKDLRGYAAATFWAAVAGILSVPLLSVAVTSANPPGHKELSADLSGAQILNLLAAVIVWVIASAMARAAKIARENEQFV
jgi:hypothetical protein